MSEKTCARHRKELLRFLLLKTAAVRSGVKPGELLRIRHCYRPGRGRFCLYRQEVFELLGLDYLELRREPESSLVLFFHREKLLQALAAPANRAVLRRCGYPDAAAPAELPGLLKARFEWEAMPHEVGVFIGYPAKDVLGFIEKRPKTPVHKGDWQVFGDADESLARMKLYRQVERLARQVFDACEDLPAFFNHIANIIPNNIAERNLANG